MKFFTWFSVASLLLQILSGVFLSQPIRAEELSPTPTIEASPTPAEIPSLTPEPTNEPEPTLAPSPNSTPPATTEVSSSVSPVENNQPVDSSVPNPTPTLSETDSSPPQSSLSTTIFHEVSAQSLELNLDSQSEAGSASLTTDKADYVPTDTALISGTGFLLNTAYTLIISSDDAPAVNFQTEVTTNNQGKFIYAYQLDGMYRPNYKVEIKDSEGKVLATVAFTDSDAIFSDGFESDNFSSWSSVDAPKWEIINGSVGGGTTHEGTKRAQVKGNTNGNDVLLKNQSTSGYQNLSLTYWYKIKENLEAGDHVLVQWSTDGSTWNDLADYSSLSSGEWTQATFNLPAGANNQSGFRFRFQATLDAGNDEFQLDDISLTGDTADTGTITIDKVVEGGDVPSSNWSFNILDDQAQTVESDLHDGGSVTLPTGTYTISESTIAGYTLTGATGVCSDFDGPNATLTVTGEGGTCTLTNTQDSDTTAPTVLNVSATDANGTYYTGETVHVTVQFSESVTVTPYYWFTCTFWGFCPDHYEYPKLQLQLDGQTRWLAYTSGSGTDTLQFDYVVADGDGSDAINYVDTASLIYNSRDTSQVTIKDTAGNAADVTLPAVGSEESLDGQKDIAINRTSTARLRAFKYFDVDQNGSYDGEDYPLEGWRISLYNDRGFTFIDDRVTGADGYTDYWEDVPVEDPNELVLQEQPEEEGWIAINPADESGYGTYWDGEVVVEAGGEHTFSFGNWYPSDTTAPILSEVTSVSTPTNNSTPSYTFNSSEDGNISYGGACSSSTSSAVAGDNTITFNALSDGTYSDCTITVTDSVGNSSDPLAVSSFNVDTQAPTSSFVSPSDNSFWNSSIHIEGSSTDSSGDTVDYVTLSYSETGADDWYEITQISNNNLNEPFNWNYDWEPEDGERSYDIMAEATDTAGNTEESPIVENVTYDITAPEIPSADPIAGDYGSDQSVSLSSSDSLSGLDKIYYTTDGSIPDTTKTEYTEAITVDKDMTIKTIAYDKAGNSSEILTASYGIAPKISGESSSSVTSSSATITWTTDDLATSRVIYDTVSHDVLGAAPNYGYANSTTEADTDPKVTSHSVDITGLTAGTTYYYRTISHGSPEAVGDEKSVTTTTVASAATTTSTSSDGGGTVQGAVSAPVCNDSKPGSAPTLLSAVGGVNSVILTWSKAVDPVSYYLVAYGTSTGSQQFGNPNVGGNGTTSYTVNGLSGGVTYYFKVRAGNGCAPGDYSNELSAAPVGGFVTGPATGFTEGVLGAKTAEEEQKIEEEKTGEVLGGEMMPTPTLEKENLQAGIFSARNIWISLAGLFILLVFFFYRRRRGRR